MRRRIFVFLTLSLVASTLAYWSIAGAADNKQASPAQATPAAMSKEGLQTFLAQPLIARLAVVRANGTPQVSPMWFLYEDGVMYMSTRPERAKVKHLKANPRVAVVVDVMEAPLKNKVVTLEGTVEVQTTGVKEMTTKIYRKYMGAEGAQTPAAQQNINAPRVILKITPQKVESVDTTR
jgi:PPOX class probable F420-dependent enzyme